jgi:hypothetical protein
MRNLHGALPLAVAFGGRDARERDWTQAISPGTPTRRATRQRSTRMRSALLRAALLDTLIVSDGESTWLDGVALIGLDVISAAGAHAP